MFASKAEIVADAGAHMQPIDYAHAHRLEAVAVGGFIVWASAGIFLTPCEMDPRMLHVPLTRQTNFRPGVRYQIMPIPMEDFGGVPKQWKAIIAVLVAEIKGRKPVHIFCDGGHGRTGTVLASLIALMESSAKTPDPIAAVRARYCDQAVETLDQARAIYRLRGEDLPLRWARHYAEMDARREAYFRQRQR